VHHATRSLTATLLLLALSLGACDAAGVASPSPSSPGTPPSSPAATDREGGSASPPRPASPSATAGAATFDIEAVELDLEVVTGGLESPLAVVHADDGSGRLFVVEQTGRLRIVRDDRLEDAPYLDLRDRVLSGGERGLLGLAFHPDFPDDPRLFVNYTDRNGNTVVSSFAAGEDGTPADPTSEMIVLQVEQPYANHNGGALAFGPDGYLYIATGDGGAGGDPHDHGQRIDTLLGKILRIDVDRTDGDRAYGIPEDNPLVDDPDAQPEIFLSGLRNPWRMSFDRQTGDLWIGDVGQGTWEEVNVARAGQGGLNFGWSRMEGVECFQDAGCEDPAYTLPVAEYGHDLGCSVTGGVVYRGARVPGLTGGYVFADYCSGNVWVLDPGVDGRSTARLVLASGRSISALGEDEAGEAYVTDLNAGELLRIAPAGG
jgi:glucose/arabinose dehydrogenase